mmetsp:Transcript_15896/g.34831  ORF Transcript_15896/g.34831 Transcript_15896/m.34831 type:complete len:619 (-) Transcript_15896:58-1914(-)
MMAVASSAVYWRRAAMSLSRSDSSVAIASINFCCNSISRSNVRSSPSLRWEVSSSSFSSNSRCITPIESRVELRKSSKSSRTVFKAFSEDLDLQFKVTIHSERSSEKEVARWFFSASSWAVICWTSFWRLFSNLLTCSRRAASLCSWDCATSLNERALSSRWSDSWNLCSSARCKESSMKAVSAASCLTSDSARSALKVSSACWRASLKVDSFSFRVADSWSIWMPRSSSFAKCFESRSASSVFSRSSACCNSSFNSASLVVRTSFSAAKSDRSSTCLLSSSRSWPFKVSSDCCRASANMASFWVRVSFSFSSMLRTSSCFASCFSSMSRTNASNLVSACCNASFNWSSFSVRTSFSQPSSLRSSSCFASASASWALKPSSTCCRASLRAASLSSRVATSPSSRALKSSCFAAASTSSVLSLLSTDKSSSLKVASFSTRMSFSQPSSFNSVSCLSSASRISDRKRISFWARCWRSLENSMTKSSKRISSCSRRAVSEAFEPCNASFVTSNWPLCSCKSARALCKARICCSSSSPCFASASWSSPLKIVSASTRNSRSRASRVVSSSCLDSASFSLFLSMFSKSFRSFCSASNFSVRSSCSWPFNKASASSLSSRSCSN